MKEKQRGTFSLKWVLSFMVGFCWVVPILIVVSLSGYLLNHNYEQHISNQLEAGTEHAMEQVKLRMESVLEASKAASYDGIIQKAHRNYQETGNQVQLYRSCTGYLSKAYSRDDNIKAAFLTFRDHPEVDYTFVDTRYAGSYETLRNYRTEARDLLLNQARIMDTGIAFRNIDGELYMVRNMMDKSFQPYAVLVILCNKEVLFQSLSGTGSLSTSQITIDDTILPLTYADESELNRWDQVLTTRYTTEVDGHTLTYKIRTIREDLWGAMPDLRSSVATVILLVIPMILAAVLLFYHHVTGPVETLVEASRRVQNGERGYQIESSPMTTEFQSLTRHFNSMSRELKAQFEKIYLEQQALQEARIKALQSQINPHFLGNTLEIINWEARIAEDDKVSAMIEALSTMLDAAIGRDGRNLISLEEELKYVDAYLYIIKQRMGTGLTIEKEVDENLLQCIVPRLILQPLVENAVDHDISRRRQSVLSIRIYRDSENLLLDVEHDGTMTPEDKAKIRALLDLSQENPSQKGRVGMRNLNQRIKLIYGENAALSIDEIREGKILARVCLPCLSQNGKTGELSN